MKIFLIALTALFILAVGMGVVITFSQTLAGNYGWAAFDAAITLLNIYNLVSVLEEYDCRYRNLWD